MYKRSQFAYENELRALLRYYPPEEEPSDQDQPIGIWKKPIDLAKLVENLYVAPGAPKWFWELIKHFISKYGFDESVVHQSSLDSEPVT
jgi:hypothetical protein